jgi:energy-converting hydrogenase Eha subunit C
MAKSLTAAQILDNVEDLGTLLEADIENLSFIALVGADPTLMGPGQRGILRAFIAFIRHRANEDNPIGDNWNEITREEFSTYGVGPSFNGTIFGSPSPSNPSTPAASSTHACDAVADFKRGIKRDPLQFPILKDDKQWAGGMVVIVLTLLKLERLLSISCLAGGLAYHYADLQFLDEAESCCRFDLIVGVIIISIIIIVTGLRRFKMTRKTKGLDHEKLVTVFHGSSLGSSSAIFIYGDCGSPYLSYKSY